MPSAGGRAASGVASSGGGAAPAKMIRRLSSDQRGAAVPTSSVSGPVIARAPAPSAPATASAA